MSDYFFYIWAQLQLLKTVLFPIYDIFIISVNFYVSMNYLGKINWNQMRIFFNRLFEIIKLGWTFNVYRHSGFQIIRVNQMEEKATA